VGDNLGFLKSNVAYPTDAGLLAKAVGKIAATGRRIRAASGATRTKLGDRSRTGEAGARGCVEGAIAGRGRTRGGNGCGEEANAELADLADTARRRGWSAVG
jgi:transposase, IS5 family